MSDVVDLGKKEVGTDFHLEGEDGAIIMRKDGVELLLPDINLDENLPKHLVPLFALSMILGNEPKLQAAIDDMYKYIDDLQPKDPNV
jgi:hypothetical protein